MADPVYLTINEFPGTGTPAPTVVDFAFAGGYISPAHVKAEIFNPATYLRTPVTVTDDNFVTDYRLSLPVVVPTGSVLRVYRDTPKDQPLVDFTNGARIAENNLDLVARQAVFVAAESADQIEATQVADVLQAVEAAALSATVAQTEAEASAASAVLSQAAAQEGASIAGEFALAAASSAAASSASAATSAAEASAVRADLASTASGKGAEMVAADDGASGSLWTTVAGFIARLRSSAGAAMVGFIQSGIGAVHRPLQDKASEVVSVKDFGAVGDGVADDTAAIQAAVNFSKLSKIFNNGENGTPRGGVKIEFPPGIYSVAGTVTLNNINGLKFVGAGKESTIIVHTATTGALFDVNQMISTTFENMGVAAGTVTVNGLGAKSINVRPVGSRTTTLFKWNTDAGGDRFNVWNQFQVKGGFARVWDVGGSTTHSENTAQSCDFFNCDFIWYSNNAQSLNTYFIGCNAEFISESVFYYAKGGYLTVIGGSYINPKDTLTLAGSEADIGSGNGQFVFKGVKWEMYQNIDAATNPYLLRSTSTAYAQVTFENCSNNAGSPNAEKTIISVASSMQIEVKGCDFVGVVTTSPSPGTLGLLTFENCRLIPAVTRTLNGGARYKVRYKNCGGKTVNVLNKADVDDDNNRVFSYEKNAVRLKHYGVIGSASTTSLSFKVPSGVIFNSAIVSVGRGGGASIDVNVYLDAAKTVPLFALATGSTVTHRIWNPAITYSGSAVTTHVSGTDVYMDIVSGGNAGLVGVVVTLEYVSHG